MPETSLDLSSGSLLGDRYRLVGEIGRGGMASVHRARDEVLHRPVAVKVLHAHLAADRLFRDRFQREARAAARLSHPNVVTVHDWGEQEGTAYLVMELIEGVSLRDLLNQRERLSPAEILTLLVPAAEGLAAAHAADMIHRDVKPENVLYGRDGTVKVTDFGLARAAAASRQTFGSGVIVGSPHYLSPEAVHSEPLDARSDVYALGVVLYECLTGDAPFEADTPLATALAHTQRQVPRPSSVVGDVPGALDELVARATARNPDDRPGDAAAFAEALQAAIPDGPVPVELEAVETATTVLPAEADATVVADGGGDEQAASRRRWQRWGVLAAAALVVGVFLLWDQVLAPVTPVPEVVDTSRSAAVAALREAGFEASVGNEPTPHLEIAEGNVVSVEPSEAARRGTTVSLMLSAGPPQVEVPDVAGAPRPRAVAALKEAKLAPQVRRAFHERVPSGQVIGTDPAGGETIEATSKVTVTVSKGRQPLEVPDLVGRSREQALSSLQDRGLDGEVVSRAFNAEVAAGAVAGQRPSPGETLFRGDTVELTLSRGAKPFGMPDVRGAQRAQARQQLEAKGLRVEIEEVQTLPIFNEEGTVADQDPLPGAEVRKGDSVTIFVWV